MTPDERNWFVPNLEVFICSFVLVLFAGKTVFKSYPKLSHLKKSSRHELFIHLQDIQSTPFQPPTQSGAQISHSSKAHSTRS